MAGDFDLEKLFKDRLSKDEPVFKEEYWQDFESLLDSAVPVTATEPATALGKFMGLITSTKGILASVAVVIALSASAYLYFHSQSGELQTKKESASPINSSSESSPISASGSSTVSTSKSSPISSSGSSTVSSSKSSTQSSTGSSTVSSSISSNLSSSGSSTVSSSKSSTQSTTGSSTVSASKSSPISSSGSSTVLPGVTASSAASPQIASPGPVASDNVVKTPDEKEIQVSAPVSESYVPVVKGEKNNVVTVSGNENAEKNVTAGNVPEQGRIETHSRVESAQPQQVDSAVVVPQKTEPAGSVSPQGTATPAASSTDMTNAFNDSPFHLFMAPGAAFYKTQGNAGGFSSQTKPGFQFGAGFTYNFSPNVSLLLEMNYLRTTGHQLNQKSESVSYLFYSWITSENVENRELEQFQVPVLLRYHYHGHSLGIGPSFYALYKASGERTVQDSSIYLNHFQNSKAEDYTHGLNLFIPGVAAEYSYNFYKQHAIVFRYSYYFKSLTEKSVYNIQGSNGLSFFSIMLRVRVF